MNQFENFAVIDIGSNSVTLSIFRSSSKSKKTLINIHSKKIYFGLQNYVNSSKDEKFHAIIKLMDIVMGMKKISKEYNARLKIIATSAMREVSKELDLKNIFLELTRTEIKILSSKQEGYYSFLGAIEKIKPKKGILLFDLGGGSLETGIFDNKKIKDIESIILGSLQLKIKFFSKDKYTSLEIENCRKYIKGKLEKFYKYDSYNKIIGIGGTVRNLGKIKIPNEKKQSSKNNLEITKLGLEKIIKMISKYDKHKLSNMKGLNPNRSDTILPGLLVVSEIMTKSKAKKLQISSNGLREGYMLRSNIDIPYF